MNTNPELITQFELDLLVEGELSAAERSDLIQRLSSEPSGWQRCAVAFLESQSLSMSIQGLVQSNPKRLSSPSPPVKDNTSQRNFTTIGRWVSGLAAILLLGCSFWIGSQFSSSPVQVSEKQSDAASVNPSPSQSISLRDMREVSLQLVSMQLPDSEIVAVASLKTQNEVRYIPIIRSANLERQLAILPRPKLPAKASRDLAQAGWKMRTRRQLLSIQSPGGSSRILPIDSVDYQFVGQQTF